MTLGDIDALAIAREQLAVLQLMPPPQSIEARLQLGLLAAQIAIAERMPSPQGRPHPSRAREEFVWDVVTLVRYLDHLHRNTRNAIRLLIAEGGAATPDRLRELTGAKSLSTLKTSERKAGRAALPEVSPLEMPRLICTRENTDNSTYTTISRYYLQPEVVPMIVEALAELDRREVDT